MMKRNILILLVLVCVSSLFTSCSDDEWGNNNPEMEHIYYYGLGNVKFPGGNELVYNVNQGETLAVPTYFWSVFTRPYSPVVAYYTSSAEGLECGKDYQVVDAQGNVLAPDTNEGGYSMVWKNAVKGSQNVYIKALPGKKGRIRVLTFDPAKKMDVTDVESTVIVRTNEYEVRAFSENYYVTVNIK